MQIVLGKTALARVDQYRKLHGIRTRKAAVEAMLAVVPLETATPETVPLKVEEHPLDKKLREARANPSTEKIPARVKRSFDKMRQERENGTLQTVSHQEMMQRLARRKNGSPR